MSNESRVMCKINSQFILVLDSVLLKHKHDCARGMVRDISTCNVAWGVGGRGIAREARITTQHSHLPAVHAGQGTCAMMNHTDNIKGDFALPCCDIMALPRSSRARHVTPTPDEAQQFNKQQCCWRP